MVARHTLLCHVALLGSMHYKPNCYLYIKHFHCGALMQYIEHGSAQCTAMIAARQCASLSSLPVCCRLCSNLSESYLPSFELLLLPPLHHRLLIAECIPLSYIFYISSFSFSFFLGIELPCSTLYSSSSFIELINSATVLGIGTSPDS
jgi:hypothetical protein